MLAPTKFPTKRDKRGRIPFLLPMTLLISVLLFWEGGILALDVPSYLIPRPTQVLTALYGSLPALLKDCWITFVESVMGLLIAVAAAVVLASVFVMWRPSQAALMPYIVAFRSVPVIAFAPLLVLWFGNGLTSKVVAAALIAFFPPLINILRGMQSYSTDYADLFHGYGANRWQVLCKLRMPWSLPFFFASLKISAALAVVGAMVGEFFGADQGLGHAITVHSYQLNTPAMFGALTASGALGLAMYGAMAILERWTIYWPTGERAET